MAFQDHKTGSTTRQEYSGVETMRWNDIKSPGVYVNLETNEVVAIGSATQFAKLSDDPLTSRSKLEKIARDAGIELNELDS